MRNVCLLVSSLRKWCSYPIRQYWYTHTWQYQSQTTRRSRRRSSYYNADWNHAHFSLKFAEYRKGQSMYSTDRFNLKWFKDDAMYCREIYCYDLFKRFGVWTAPRASYARLTIYVEGDAQPAYFGVYSIIEAVNDDYLKYRVLQGKFTDDNGNLWKANWGADLSSMDDSKMGVENITLDPSTMQTYVYDLKTNKKNGLAAAKVQLKTLLMKCLLCQVVVQN